MIFGGLEGIFRLVDFKYYPVDTGLIIPSEYKIFFPQGEYLVSGRKDRFLINKPDDEIRVFIIGGSSVRNLRHAVHLRSRLDEHLPDSKIHMVNCGYEGWGTHRVVLLFEEILNYDPDLIILYTGHNEFEEEYIRKVFKRDERILKLNNRMLELSRFYQFFNLVIRKGMIRLAQWNIGLIKKDRHLLFSKDVKIKWDVDFDQQAKDQIHQNYQHNLEQMIRMAKNRKIPLIISTVAYNRLIEPFKDPDGNFKKCMIFLAQTKNIRKAKECLEKALQDDIQPHRATNVTNGIIKELAQIYDIPLADVDMASVNYSRIKIPGKDLFKDHCHFNDFGTQLQQEIYFRTIVEHNIFK